MISKDHLWVKEMKNKVDRSELDYELRLKTSKLESEMMLRQIDILHK